MAKKHLEQYDENGQRVDIYLNDDEVMVDDKTLAEKLDEMQEDIEDAASHGGIQQETDPTVPSWAKQQTKPTYTAQEVGAMPEDTEIPSKTSDLDNDSGFITLADVPEGAVVLPATATPQMDGTAAVGSSERYAREDHVHPHDTAKQDVITNLATIIANAGKGVADVSSPQEDGSFTITLANGDTYTVNLNHQHTQYQPLLSSANAGSNITITTDQQTGNIIISATGGGGGGVTVDPSITGASQANPVAGGAIYTALQAKANANEMSIVDISNDTTRKNIQLKSGLSATVVTQHQSLAGRVQSQDVVSIVKISQAAYDALQTKDSTTLYLITES